MCQSALVVTAVFFITRTNADSTEDQHAFTYYAPSTLNFHDIYANNLALLGEDPSTGTSILEDDSFHLRNVPAQFVEFHPQTQTVTPVTIPSPKYILSSSLLKNDSETSTTPLTSTTTTEEPDPVVKVLPITKRTKYQRGVLDLLFPATRVKNFKSVFDTVRRLLSHTF